jgi:hypothetical protein
MEIFHVELRSKSARPRCSRSHARSVVPVVNRAQRLKEKAMLNDFSIDEAPHNRDGLVITAGDGEFRVDAFISRQVMDEWVEPIAPPGRRRSLYRSQYNDLGRRNLPAIARIVSAKYARGKTFNRQHPYVEVLTDDVINSREVIDRSGLVRHQLPPAFHSVLR